MNRDLACEIVKDLLPLYVDGMVSDVSGQSIEDHLERCKDCTEVYQNMAFGVEKEKQPTEVENVKRFLKKTKRMYFLYGLGVLSFIAVIVCMIVDLALNKGITWSLIVFSSIILANAFMYSLLMCKKNKGYITMSVVSVGTIVLLFTIQISRYYLMDTGTFWIIRYGIPIWLLWVGLLWVPVLCKCALKWNIWDCIAVFMVMSLIGNCVTKLITGDYGWNDLWNMETFIRNELGQVVGAVVFGVIGRIKKWRK